MVYLYSRGGLLGPALDIAKDVRNLQLTTVAPELAAGIEDKVKLPRNGPRWCRLLPDDGQRRKMARKAFDDWSKQDLRAAQNNTVAPAPFVLHGDFDPRFGIGDQNCACASACFFIWAAGGERRGDVVEIHRPHFDASEYAKLDLPEAHDTYQKLMDAARSALTNAGIPQSIIDRTFSTDSENSSYLSGEELESLRAAPYLSEMKIAKCGPEPRLEDQSDEPYSFRPTGRYADLSPQTRRWLIARAKREMCWFQAQDALRASAVDRYLKDANHR
jgi:hypothetical protein